MNLNSFSYVIEIEHCGSINRAAQNLYISQSNLSSALKSLEDELGYAIFSRTNKGIFPTPEGYLFIQSAKSIMVEVEKIYNVPSRIDPNRALSVSCTWSAQFFQNFMSFKANNNPDTRDSYKETGLLQNFRDVQENQYHISVFYCFHSRTSHHQAEARKTNLDAEVLVENLPVVALLSKSHPLAGRKNLKLSDTHSCPLTLFEGFEADDYLNILKVPANQQVLYVFDRGGITDLLSQNQFITIVKKGTINHLKETNLVEIPILDLRDSFDVLVLRHKTYQPNHRERLFLDYLKESLKRNKN